MVVLKGKRSGDPMIPATGIAMGRQGGYDRRTGVLGLCSLSARVTEITKVELLVNVARQGKETVHLDGNRSDLVGRQGRHRRYWWS